MIADEELHSKEYYFQSIDKNDSEGFEFCFFLVFFKRT